MKILMSSYSFAPAIGGIETVSGILAREFYRLGHDVTVVTKTPGILKNHEYPVHRNPSMTHLWDLTKYCDILFQNHISLNFIWPALLLHKPIAITYHTWLKWDGGRVGIFDHLKRLLMHRCHGIGISHAIARYLPESSVVIYNPYEDSDFSPFLSISKHLDIVYIGRLVDNKGVDILIDSIAMLRRSRIFPSVTIIGDGAARRDLEAMCKSLQLEDQVRFVGELSGAVRGQELAKHRVMVVPSRWPEPFGLVALEGIASGCAIIGSASGGLPEAIGRCGLLFANGDAVSLCRALEQLLTDDGLRNQLTARREAHLAKFKPELVARTYIEEFERILGT